MRGILIFSALLSFNLAIAKDHQSTTYHALAVHYPPLFDEQAADFGSLPSYITPKLKSMGWNIKLKFLPHIRLIEELKQNNWLLAYYPLALHDNMVLAVFPEKSFKVHLVRLRQESKFLWQGEKGLNGSTVASFRSSKNMPKLLDQSKANFEIIYTSNMEQTLRMLLAKRVDYALTVDETLGYYTRKYKVDKASFQLSTPALSEMPYAIAVNTKHPDSKRLLQQLKHSSQPIIVQ